MALRRRTLLGLAGAGLLGGLGWNVTRASVGGQVTGPEDRPDADDEDVTAYARENAAFGLDLLRELAEADRASNLMVSPVSASGGLAMAWAGARGETEAEMREALRFPLGQADLHPAVGALQYDLGHRAEAVPRFEVPQVWRSNTFELAVANALWGQAGYPFREDFLETTEENYGGGFREVDFEAAPGTARSRINDWAATATDGNVDELIPPNVLDEFSRLVLTNAVYLLADWERPFDPDDTEEREFTALGGSTSRVPMMRQEEEFSRVVDRGAGYQIVELPYVGGEVSMVVVLPPSGEFEAFVGSLDGAWLAARFAELDERDPVELRLTMPRFEFEAGFELSDSLRAMGMDRAFDPRSANFDGIAPRKETGERLFVGDVFHDAYVRVDEEGTEAAAVTGVHMMAESAPPSVTLDRPFLFLIRDRGTDAVLFLGRVVDAAAATV